MSNAQASVPMTSLWANHARLHPFTATSLAIALFAVVWLLATSIVQIAGSDANPVLHMALLGGAAGFATTTLGAIPGLFLRGISQRLEDSLLGEKSCAYLVVKHPLRAVEVRRFLREQGVAEFKLPDRVESVDALPLTPVGKVDKKQLRLWLAERARG